MNKTVRDILLFAAGFGAGALVMHTVFEKKYETYYADGALVFDGESKPVDEDDLPTLIGTEALKHIGEFAPSMIHVRNNNYHKDYEILQAQQCWANVLSEEDE